jgi:hypothetical protein
MTKATLKALEPLPIGDNRGAMKPIDLALIQARRAKIASEVAEETTRFDGLKQVHEARIGDLEAELGELEIAERIFAKLSGC